MLVVRVLMPVVEAKVQAHPVTVGEAVLAAVGIGLRIETERGVVRQSAPQVAHGKDGAEAFQPGPGRAFSVHGNSMPRAARRSPQARPRCSGRRLGQARSRAGYWGRA